MAPAPLCDVPAALHQAYRFNVNSVDYFLPPDDELETYSPYESDCTISCLWLVSSSADSTQYSVNMPVFP